jgi:hypothetical protein
MRNRIDIDQQIVERSFKRLGRDCARSWEEEPELPRSLKTQIERLRELEEQSPSIIPAAERWNQHRR